MVEWLHPYTVQNIQCCYGFAPEAELRDIHLNAQTAIIMRQTLENIGHPQPPTPIHTDNKTTCGSANITLKKMKIQHNGYAIFQDN